MSKTREGTRFRRLRAALSWGSLLGVSLWLVEATPALAAGAQVCQVGQPEVGTCPNWVTTYHGPTTANRVERGLAIASSRDGGTVFVAGASTGSGGPQDYVVIALNTATGAQRWLIRHTSPSGHIGIYPSAATVSRDGSLLFVTGTDYDANFTTVAALTVAYSTGDGHEVWSDMYRATGATTGQGIGIRTSVDGQLVYLGAGTDVDAGNGTRVGAFAFVAYRAGNGSRAWETTYNADGDMTPFGFAINPGGDRLYETGIVSTPSFAIKAVAVVVDSAGAKQWTAEYAAVGCTDTEAYAVTPDSDGSGAVFTGYDNNCSPQKHNMITVAYSPAGQQRWAAEYAGDPTIPTVQYNSAYRIGSTPTGRIYVGGFSAPATTAIGGITPIQGTGDYVVLAYNTDGTRAWVNRFDGGSYDGLQDLLVAPGGDRVFATGFSYRAGSDWATLAIDAVTGTQVWLGRYHGSLSNNFEQGTALALSPSGAQLFVAGDTFDGSNNRELGALAYETGAPPIQLPEAPVTPGLILSGTAVMVAAARRAAARTDATPH